MHHVFSLLCEDILDKLEEEVEDEPSSEEDEDEVGEKVVGGQEKVVERRGGDNDDSFIREMGLDKSEGEGEMELELEELDDSFADPDYTEEVTKQVLSSSDEDLELEDMLGLGQGRKGGTGKKRGLGMGSRKEGAVMRGSLRVGPSGEGKGKEWIPAHNVVDPSGEDRVRKKEKVMKKEKEKLGIGNLSGFPSSLDTCHFAAGSSSEQLRKSEGRMEICLSSPIFDTNSYVFRFFVSLQRL